MKRTDHLIAVLLFLAIAGCGDAATTETQVPETPPAVEPTPTPVASPPAHDVAIVIPEAEEGRVATGTIVELIYPGGETRGYRHFLQRWDGHAWTDAYQVFVSDPRQPRDEKQIETAWARADKDAPAPSLDFHGSEGGQYTVIPPPAPPGTYRICEQSRTLCSAAFEVTG